MTVFRNYFNVAIGLSILICVLALISPVAGQLKGITRDVTIVNAANKPVPVVTANTSSDPVFVRDVDSARQPFQTTLLISAMAANDSNNSASFVTPNNKRVVIEWISVSGG